MQWLCGLLLLMSSLEVVQVARAQAPQRVVLIVQRVTNIGRAPADDVVAHCISPATNRYQEVEELRVCPEPGLTQIDAEGQKVFSVLLGSIPPGATRAVHMLAWMRFRSVDVALGERSSQIEPLLGLVRDGCLTDDAPLRLNKVRPIAETIVKGRTGTIECARMFYDHMVEHCRYDIDAHDDSADVVLNGKPGSCSELALAFIALCRSVGIPARLVTAYVNRQGLAPSADWRTHAWAEFYDDQVGWVPVDPTNRLNYPSGNYFARQDARYLTVVDDGVPLIHSPDPGRHVVYVTVGEPLDVPRSQPEPGPASTIQSQPAESQPAPASRSVDRNNDVRLRVLRSAYWCASTSRLEEQTLFAESCKTLWAPDPAMRLQGVAGWAQARHPLRVELLLEAMFDNSPAVRKAAAVAVGDSAEPGVMIPLMDLISFEEDRAVCQAIVAAARKLLATVSPKDRAVAVGELAKSRSAQALSLLKGISADPDRDVRKKAAQMLYKFGDRPAVHEEYARLVNDEDEFVRVLAAQRWSRTGSREALQLLLGQLESSVRWDRERSLVEFKRHTGGSFGYDPSSPPDSRRNRAAIERFHQWLRSAVPTTPVDTPDGDGDEAGEER